MAWHALFSAFRAVMGELMKFTLLMCAITSYLVVRYRERKEIAEELSKRVNQRSI